jgi:hypothetical protein
LAAADFTAARLSEKLCRTGEADMSSAGEQLMKEWPVEDSSERWSVRELNEQFNSLLSPSD